MPTFQFEAMDKAGQEVRDVIEAKDQEEAQATIRQRGLFVTKLAVKKARKGQGEKVASTKKGKTFVLGGVGSKTLTTFTRQLSILQEAGLPILRSLKILEQQCKPGALKNSLIDVCDEIESGATLSEAMAKSPKAFNRLYVNMIKAGEAGGALEVILKRLAEFQERAQSLKRKVKGAMIYPIFVVVFAVGILVFIMMKIVPQFEKIFKDFGTKLPEITQLLINISTWVGKWFFLIPLIPILFWLYVKLLRKFTPGRLGWDFFALKVPIFGQLVEKNIIARSMRTLGTLVASGVPILEALHITRETSNNAAFETMYGQIYDSIREGESIAKPMKENSFVLKNKGSTAALVMMGLMVLPIGMVVGSVLAAVVPGMDFGFKVGTVEWFCGPMLGISVAVAAALTMLLAYRLRSPVLDDMVVNMVDVGEETGELDTMLYKVADTYDEEVSVLTESLTALMEPLLIITLGGIVGFIVIALFMPLIALITNLSGGK
jgi:type IV pilus assembly protein PilC